MSGNRLRQGVLLLGMLLTAPLHAALFQDPALHWRTLYTPHFAIHFHDGEAALARETGAIAERVHEELVPLLDWRPAARTQLVLTDRFDYANGSATPFPRNTMRIIVTPPDSESGIADYDNWLEMLIRHEYTHILHLDQARGWPAGLRRVFGRLLVLFPDILQPPWFIEGLATYHETDDARHIGRGQDNRFRMLMRQEVAAGIKPLRQVNQPLESWPMNSVRYLYGVYFYRFVRDHYGPDRVQALVAHYGDNLIPFMINGNSREVLGADLSALWGEFDHYLRALFGPEIRRIREAGESAATRLTHDGYFTGLPRVAANGDVYFVRDDQQSEPRLMVLRRGRGPAVALADVRARDFDLHPTAGIVVAELDAIRNTNLFSDLYRVDPVSGRKTRLTRGGRYRYASWSPDGRRLVAAHNADGRSALHLLDTDGNLLEVLWQGRDHSVLGPLEWSPDGSQVVASLWRPQGLWNLEAFTLAERRWRKLTHGQDIETTPRFSADGKSLLFSADYGGVYNIRRLDLAGGGIVTLTNVVGGAFGPAPAADGSGLYYAGLNRDGYDLYFLPDPAALPTPAEAQTPDAHTPPVTPAGAPTVEDYNALPRLRPTYWFPHLALGDERSEVGFNTAGSDPLQRHNYNLLLADDLKNDWLIGRATYLYDRWNPSLKFSLERQVFSLRDANGQAVHYRNADSFTAEALWPFFTYRQRWLLHAGLVSDIESDKRVHAGFAHLPEVRDQLLGVAVSYDSSRRYTRSISPSYGRQLRAIAEDNDALQSDSSGQVYTLDWREFFDLPGQHVLAARLVAGWGTDNPRPFRLGDSLTAGIPSNPRSAALAPTDSVFNRRRYALRGYPAGLADLTGRRMALLEAEWRFPIALIERGFMAPPAGLHKLHGSLFFDAGDAWQHDTNAGNLKTGAGAELTATLVLGYWLPLDLRLGLARGFDAGGKRQAYLGLGASF